MKKLIAIDDLSGELADATRYIGIDGEWREIDLTDAHHKQLMDAVRAFWDAGRKVVPDKVGGIVSPKRSAAAASRGWNSRDYWKEFRAWCDANGRRYTTPAGGFYPKKADLQDYEAYLDAQKG